MPRTEPRPQPRLLFGHDDQVAEWVLDHLPHLAGSGFGPSKAIGIFDALGTRILAGAVYHDYRPQFGTCQMSIASESPMWATRGTIKALLHVPFEQYGCHKIQALTSHKNERAIKFLKHIGFRCEAVLADQFGEGVNAWVFRMRRKDYARLYGAS